MKAFGNWFVTKIVIPSEFSSAYRLHDNSTLCVHWSSFQENTVQLKSVNMHWEKIEFPGAGLVKEMCRIYHISGPFLQLGKSQITCTFLVFKAYVVVISNGPVHMQLPTL